MMAMVVRTTKKRATFRRRIDAAEVLIGYVGILQRRREIHSTLDKTLFCTTEPQLLFHTMLRAKNSSREHNIRSIIQRLCCASISGLLDLLTA